jgi:hypothetical protein
MTNPFKNLALKNYVAGILQEYFIKIMPISMANTFFEVLLFCEINCLPWLPEGQDFHNRRLRCHSTCGYENYASKKELAKSGDKQVAFSPRLRVSAFTLKSVNQSTFCRSGGCAAGCR